MDREQIRARMLKGESFWVETVKERHDACVINDVMELDYITRKDDRGGFYIVKIEFPKRPNKGTK